jgi:hypothetical protein
MRKAAARAFSDFNEKRDRRKVQKSSFFKVPAAQKKKAKVF